MEGGVSLFDRAFPRRWMMLTGGAVLIVAIYPGAGLRRRSPRSRRATVIRTHFVGGRLSAEGDCDGPAQRAARCSEKYFGISCPVWGPRLDSCQNQVLQVNSRRANANKIG